MSEKPIEGHADEVYRLYSTKWIAYFANGSRPRAPKSPVSAARLADAVAACLRDVRM